MYLCAFAGASPSATGEAGGNTAGVYPGVVPHSSLFDMQQIREILRSPRKITQEARLMPAIYLNYSRSPGCISSACTRRPRCPRILSALKVTLRDILSPPRSLFKTDKLIFTAFKIQSPWRQRRLVAPPSVQASAKRRRSRE